MLSEQSKTAIRAVYQQIRSSLPAFVSRKEQNYLVAEMAKVLAGQYDRQRRILVAEAGTGIGKSLSYLMASVPMALSHNKTLVISTATVALQEQLIDKDLPFFKKHAGLTFEFALVKGRQRYCCEHKLEILAQANNQADLDFDWQQAPQKKELVLLDKLYQAYLRGEWAGDRDSWPDPLPDALWQHIVADRHSCSRALKHHQHCPFHRARQSLEQKQVLVVNHALLLADLELGGGVILPEPEDCFYVLDEAHHLPTVTRDFSSAQVSLLGARSWLDKLSQTAKKLLKIIPKEGCFTPSHKLMEAIHSLRPGLAEVHSYLTSRTDQFEQHIFRFPEGELPESLVITAENIRDEAKTAGTQLNKLIELLCESVKDGDLKQRDVDPLLAETGFFLQRLENLQQCWHMLSQASPDRSAPNAKWAEQLTDRAGDFLVAASPIEVGHTLERLLWSRCAGALLCSATLTALNSFDYFRRQVGLKNNDGTQYLRLNSPFDFDRAELFIPKTDCDPSDSKFTTELSRRIPALLPEDGASLVLFASYWQMQEVVEQLRNMTQLDLLVQGEASRQSLLKKHKKRCDSGKGSILFGTGSFSEGLDLPGHYLTNLIITKIPFAVPTSPVEAAHAEWIERCGGNPFLQISVPEASKKLIQSCGRLMRKEQDSGRITLLDRRLVTRRYGKGLLDALPPYKRNIER